MRPHRGTLILILGILSILLCNCWPLGLVAFFLGNSDLNAMRAGTMDPQGQTLTNVGRILGLVSVILAVVSVILYATGIVNPFTFVQVPTPAPAP